MHASEDAEQLHGASERLRRALDRVAAAETALSQARRELHAAQRAEYGWTDGLVGRRLVADALAALAPSGWTFLDAVHWPGRPGVVIDHVGVGPGGVVVMFSRQWTGAVEVRGGVLRQNGIPRLRETSAVSAAAAAIVALLDPSARTAVSAFVCAVQHDVRPETVPPGVNVVGVRDVGSAVAALTPRFTAAQVDDVLARLSEALVGPEVPEQLTTRALTVYGEGGGLPWSARPDDGLFDAPPTASLPLDPPLNRTLDDGPDGEASGRGYDPRSDGQGYDAPMASVAPPAGPVPGLHGPADPFGAGLPDQPGQHGQSGQHGQHGHPGGYSQVAAGQVPGQYAGHHPVASGWSPPVADVPVVAPTWTDGARGRHRAPSRHSARTSHRAARDARLERPAVLVTAGLVLATVLAWAGFALR